MTYNTLAEADEAVRKYSGEMYETDKREMAIKADGAQKAEGDREGQRQEIARKESGQEQEDSGDAFKVDLIEGASAIGAGLKVAKIGLEVFDDRKSDPGTFGDSETLETRGKETIYNAGVNSSHSVEMADTGREIRTTGDYSPNYAIHNTGTSLANSGLNEAFTTTAADVETTVGVSIQLCRSLNLCVQQKLGNAMQAKSELAAAPNVGFAPGGGGGMQLANNRPEQGPKGYTTKVREEESTETNWG